MGCDADGARIEAERGILAPGARPLPAQETLFPHPPEPPATLLSTSRPGANTVLSKSPENDWFYRETSPGRAWGATRVNLGSRRSALGSLPVSPDVSPVASAVKRFLETGVKRLRPRAEAMRRPCPPAFSATAMAADGCNVPLLVRRLASRDRPAFDRWLGRLRTAVPGPRRRSSHRATARQPRPRCPSVRRRSGDSRAPGIERHAAAAGRDAAGPPSRTRRDVPGGRAGVRCGSRGAGRGPRRAVFGEEGAGAGVHPFARTGRPLPAERDPRVPQGPRWARPWWRAGMPVRPGNRRRRSRRPMGGATTDSWAPGLVVQAVARSSGAKRYDRRAAIRCHRVGNSQMIQGYMG